MAPPNVKLPTLCAVGLSAMIEKAIAAGAGAPLPEWPLQGLVDGSYFQGIPEGLVAHEIATIDAELADPAKRGHSL